MTYVSGTRWSGLQSEPTTPFKPYDPNAPEEVARRKAFSESPRGRFLAALKGIQQLPSYEAFGWKAYAACQRGFRDPDSPPSVGELGVASLALAEVPGNDAREARAALAEIMIESHRRRAA